MDNIVVVVGTNEEYVVGYKLLTSENGKISLQQSFANHSHKGSVRQVAVGGRFLVSGSTDETIMVFNLKTQMEVGTIMEHQGTITNLVFHGSEYMFSAAEDGKICIFDSRKWQCEKSLKANAGGVTGLAIHPSGKIALSVGRDKSLHTWNLIKGRRAYITKLKKVADSVHWSPGGSTYLVVKGSCVDLYDVASGQGVHSMDFKQLISSVIFVTDDIIAVGGGSQNICLYDLSTKMELLQWQAHSMRIKSLCLVPRPGQDHVWLVSGSSDKTIKVWQLQLLSLSSEPQLLCEADTGCRIICMEVYCPPQPSSLDPAQGEGDASSEEDATLYHSDQEQEGEDSTAAAAPGKVAQEKKRKPDNVEKETQRKRKKIVKKHKLGAQKNLSKNKKIKFSSS